VFLQPLQALQPQLYLGAPQQATAAQPSLLTAFTGLAVLLLPQAHLLVLLGLLEVLHTHLRFTQPTLRVRVQVRLVIQLLLLMLEGVSFTLLPVLILGILRRALIIFLLLQLVAVVVLGMLWLQQAITTMFGGPCALVTEVDLHGEII
jgi:hypothetical protein